MSTVNVDMAEANKALDKAKVTLMTVKNSTFITSILWSLKFSWNSSIPTARTDGLTLEVNPEWFMGLTPGARVGLLAHESWHPALEHPIRGIGFDHRIYNIAADYVINIMLEDAGYELPPQGYVDAKYRNMTTEQVYNIIYSDEKENPSSDFNPDIQMGDGGDSPSGGGASELQEQLDSILVKAALEAEMAGESLQAGNIPSDVLRRIEELTNPKLPWETILLNYANTYAKTEYSFSRPKKKFMPDFYLPALSGTTINHIAGAADSSGSVNDAEFTSFLQQVETILSLAKPNRVTIMDFDTKVKSINHITQPSELWDLKFKGYGGTDLKPVFEEARKLNPDLFIVFSDLHCKPIKKETPFPVIWVVVNNPNAKVNFGHKIDIEVKNE